MKKNNDKEVFTSLLPGKWMKSQKSLVALTFCVIIFSANIQTIHLSTLKFYYSEEQISISDPPHLSHDPLLVIYTTGNPFGGRIGDYLEDFEDLTMIPASLIAVVHFTDPGKLLSRLLLDQNQPVADIVIGLDPYTLKIAKEHNCVITFLNDRVSCLEL